MGREVLNMDSCRLGNQGLQSFTGQLAERAQISRAEAALVMAHGVAASLQGLAVGLGRRADVAAYAKALAHLVSIDIKDDRACNLALAECRRTANILMGYAP